MLKVKEHPNLLRDPHTKAIIVNDPQGRQQYLNQRQMALKTQSMNEQVMNEVSQLKDDIQELKTAINILLEIQKNQVKGNP